MVQIYKPSVETLKKQAQEAREYEEKKKKSGDIAWAKIEEGENVFRILPPTNSRGVIGRKIYKHYFNDTIFEDQLSAASCLPLMFPEEEDTHCPICDAGDKLLAQFPTIDIKRWHKPGSSVYVQIHDREDEGAEDISQVLRLTSPTYNWLILQMEACMADGIDMTDIEAGLDIKITKSVTKMKGKGGKFRRQTKYDRTLWSPRGPTPLHEDEDLVESIVESMKDLDLIWQYPDDEGLDDLNEAGAVLYNHYMSKVGKQKVAGISENGTVVPSSSSSSRKKKRTAVAKGAETPAAAAAAPVKKKKKVEAKPEPPAVEEDAEDEVETVEDNQGGSPTDKPPCYGGEYPRSKHPDHEDVTEDDGGTGYSEESELCLSCPHELACMDECS